MSKDKLRVKLLSKMGQEQNEGSLIWRVNMYLENWESFLCLVLPFNM
jgi:hypothetical protein